jgi:MFS family permease
MSERPQRPRARYRRGLSTSVVNNASAFGFSVMITAGYGMLSHFHSHPRVPNVVLFAFGAVIGIAVIEAMVSRGFRLRPHSHPEEVVMLGTAANLVSVAVALGVFYVSGRFLPELVAWPVAPLLAAAAYVLVEAFELAVAEGVQERVLRDPDAESGE